MAFEQKVIVDNELVNKLKDQVVNRKLKIDLERTDVLAEVYKEYEGQPQIIIRARLLEKLLLTKKIYIDEYEFVGNLAGEFGAFYLYPEWDINWLESENTFEISDEEREKLEEVKNYWKTHSIKTRIHNEYKEIFGEDFEDYIKGGAFSEPASSPSGVSNSNYGKAIQKGLRKIVDETKERLQNLEISEENRDKFDFYRAVIIVYEALIAYGHRYEKLAKELAEAETDEKKKQHYETIASVLHQVPEYPATTFREALQFHLILHTTAQLEQVGCGYSNGYLGQVLEPYYQADVAKGNINATEATYLLKHHFLKLNDISYYYGRDYDLQNSGDTAQTISIGGYTENGEDATGEVDYLVLDAQLDLRLPQPPIALTYHDKLKPEFVSKALDLVQTGIGMPQFMNADVLIQRSLDAFGQYGATIQEARRSCVFGCVSTSIPNKTAYLMSVSVNIAKAVELALNEGVDPLTKRFIGVKTKNVSEIESYEEFYDIFRQQLEHIISVARKVGKIHNKINAEILQVPYRSALTDGSLESGKDLWRGGAQYYSTATTFVTGVDAGNSLLAIKKLVFEDKDVSLEDIRIALSNDFEGYEILQKKLLNVPKHGNNVSEDDAVIRQVYQDAWDFYQEGGKNYLGLYAKPDAYSKSIHDYFGKLTGALPTGRKENVALTDGSVSAQPGTDQKGPSALSISAAGAIDTVLFNSAHLNVKLNPDTFKSENGKAALVTLIDTYVKHGGNHIQFNSVDASVLRDAKVHPENHKDLVVRVAGFSAFFVKLHEGIQDEVIARTEHDLAV